MKRNKTKRQMNISRKKSREENNKEEERSKQRGKRIEAEKKYK